MRLVLAVLALLLAAAVWWALRDPGARPRAGRHATTAPAPAAAPPADTPAPGKRRPERRLVGKVTGDAPLGGVSIRVEWEGGAGEGRTADDGAYEIGDPGSGILNLRAESPDGRLGFGSVWAEAGAAETKAPAIALVPAEGVTFVTVPATPLARIEISRGAYSGPHMRATTGDDGTTTLRLPLGDYRLRAFAEGFGRASAAFGVEAGSKRIKVQLSPERKLVVTVLDKARHSPVEGARLAVRDTDGPYGTPDTLTDASGAARIRGLDAKDEVLLLVVPPGEVPQESDGMSLRRGHPVPPAVTEMTIEIDLPRTIAWEILPGDIPPPADGTVIPLREPAGGALTPPAQGVMKDGKLVADGWPGGVHVRGEALGPQGTLARLYCAPDATVGEPTKFEMSRELEVTLRNADGSQASGIPVALFNSGNNLVCRAAAGDDGVARMEQLPAQPAHLYVVGQMEWDRKELIGTVDLRKGDVSVTHVLATERRYEITLLLDGKPCLPDGSLLQVNGPPFSQERDPENGRVTGTFVPRGPLAYLTLWVPGYRRVSEQVDVPPGDEPLRHTFALDRGCECRIRIVGSQPKRIRLEFQREWPKGWETIDAENRSPRAWRRESEDGWTYTGLDPGRYRMRTMREGFTWGPVEVGGDEAVLVLDFTRFAVVRGRVEIPEGYEFKEVQLKLLGDGVVEEESEFRPGFPVSWEDGSFEVQIPGDRPVRLTARHPVLTCADSVETRAGLDGVVLRLVEGPTLTFRLPGWEARYATVLKSIPEWQRPGARVRLLRAGALPIDLFAVAKAGVWRAGGFAPGRYDVWIDTPEAMPFLLRDRELQEGVNDLGDVPSLPGSRIRVRVLTRDGFVPPSIAVWAQHLGEPEYGRHVQSGDGQAEFLLSGLGPGRFRVTGSSYLGAGRWLNEEVELDGESEIPLTLDQR